MARSQIRRYLRHGTFPQLAVFEATVRLGTISRAAEELHLAQPTASLQLRKLAETVGAALFAHGNGRASLTAAGERLHAACLDVFERLHALEASLDALRQEEGARLRLAATNTTEEFAARLLSGFVARHPGVDVALEIGNRQELLARLRGHEDDLYVFANPPEGDDVVCQAILRNPLVAIAAADSKLAGRRLSLRDLAQEPFVMREPGSGTRTVVEQAFGERGLTPCVRVALGTNSAIRAAVASGLGVSIVPRYGLDPARSNSAGLVVLDVDGLPLDGYWYIAYPAAIPLSRRASAFIALAREAVSPLDAATQPDCILGPLPDGGRAMCTPAP